jgi:hypothetical protein
MDAFDKTVPEREERTDYDALAAMLKNGVAGKQSRKVL